MTAQHPMSAELRTISTQTKSLWPASALVIARAADALDALQAERDKLQARCDALEKALDEAVRVIGQTVPDDWKNMNLHAPNTKRWQATLNAERAHREGEGS